MSTLLLEPATDWTGQLNEERLVLCAEALFVHQLIGAPAHQHIITNIRDRAEAQREICARNRRRTAATHRIGGNERIEVSA